MAYWTAPNQGVIESRCEFDDVSRQHHELARIRAENITLTRRVNLLKEINDRRNRWLAGSDAEIAHQDQLIKMAVGKQNERLARRDISHNTLLRNVKTELRSKLEHLCAETVKAAIELPDVAFAENTVRNTILIKFDTDRQRLTCLAEHKELQKKQEFQQEMQLFQPK